MNTDLSIAHLILGADIVVQAVMAILVLASIASWMLIFLKRGQLRRAMKQARVFDQKFWSGIDLASLYSDLGSEKRKKNEVERIFVAGYREFHRLRQQNEPFNSAQITETSERSMRIAIAREMDELDNHLPVLATIGSISPYIGLFGTVWGIMNSFHSLGNVQQATIAMVAPGISEALIATAMGLFAAIPAVVAYNRLMTLSGRILSRYEIIAEEFLGILQRQAQA